MTSINRYCPRSGNPVSADALTRYRGHTVGFCNPACRDDFAADPQRHPHDRGWFDALIREHGHDGVVELPTLESARLRLRTLEDRDVPALFEAFSDPEVMRYWSQAPLRDIDEAAAYLETIRAGCRRGDLMQWGIALRGDDCVIGTATLYRIDPTHRRAEIGFALARAHWRKGYASEALACLLDHAFAAMALERLEADTDPDNAAALATLELQGFRREGYLRARWRVGGGVQDTVLMGLLRADRQSTSAA